MNRYQVRLIQFVVQILFEYLISIVDNAITLTLWAAFSGFQRGSTVTYKSFTKTRPINKFGRVTFTIKLRQVSSISLGNIPKMLPLLHRRNLMISSTNLET